MKHPARGYSLIELMIVLAIIAVLLAAGLPYTRAWVDSNQQLQARNMLWEAVAQTRALAMRNPTQAQGNLAVAAQLTLSPDTNAVAVAMPGAATAAWHATLPTRPTFQLTDAANVPSSGLACIAFNNRGRLLPRCGGTGAAAIAPSQTRIVVALGNQDPLYVDLL